MENGAALGRRLCGRNDTPLVTVSEVCAITLSNSELASRMSFIPHHHHHHLSISAFEIIPTAYSYERRLLVHVRSRREVCGGGGDGAHPGPPSPGKVTAWIIGTNQVTACIESEPQRRAGLTHGGSGPGLLVSYNGVLSVGRMCDSRRRRCLPARALFGQYAKKKRKEKIKRQQKNVRDKKKGRGCCGEEQRGTETFPISQEKLGCYVVRATLFFFIIPLTAIALNYRGLSFFSRQEREGDESKIHLKKFCAGRGECTSGGTNICKSSISLSNY